VASAPAVSAVGCVYPAGDPCRWCRRSAWAGPVCRGRGRAWALDKMGSGAW